MADVLETPKVETPKSVPAIKIAVLNDKTQSNWNIIEQENESIRAVNRIDGQVFEGSIEEFNIAMRD
jgi:hypothetical protein